MVKLSNPKSTPFLFSDLEADRQRTIAQNTLDSINRDTVNRELDIAAIENRTVWLSSEEFSPRESTSDILLEFTKESLELFKGLVLKQSYGKDIRVIAPKSLQGDLHQLDKDMFRRNEERQAESMVTAFSNDLATDPYNTLLRVASHPLTSSGSFVTVPLIYYIARTDKKCAQTFDCIRQAVRDFTEEYLRNPKNFIETNKLNWKSTKDLAECFSKNTL